jgi:hypothetical protein
VHSQCYAAKLALDKAPSEAWTSWNPGVQGRNIEVPTKGSVLISNSEPKIAEVTRSMPVEVRGSKPDLLELGLVS